MPKTSKIKFRVAELNHGPEAKSVEAGTTYGDLAKEWGCQVSDIWVGGNKAKANQPVKADDFVAVAADISGS